MTNFLFKRNKGKKGFTLIELMIVIAIIAILAAILIPNFVRARAQSQLAACEGNEKNIATSLEMYSTDNSGNYPTQANGAFNTLGAAMTTNYLKTFPTCPANSQQYSYTGTGVSVTGAFTLSQGGAGSPHSTLVGTNPSDPIYQSSGGLVR